jgi:hypothetical protein
MALLFRTSLLPLELHVVPEDALPFLRHPVSRPQCGVIVESIRPNY